MIRKSRSSFSKVTLSVALQASAGGALTVVLDSSPLCYTEAEQ